MKTLGSIPSGHAQFFSTMEVEPMKRVAFLTCLNVKDDPITQLMNIDNAGIDIAVSSRFPMLFEVRCLVMFQKEIGEDPNRECLVKLIDADGKEIDSRSEKVSFKPYGEIGRSALLFRTMIPAPGHYRFDLLFDGRREEAWPLTFLLPFNTGTTPQL